MSCFSCVTYRQKEAGRRLSDGMIPWCLSVLVDSLDLEKKAPSPAGDKSCYAHSYTLQKLVAATANFKWSNLIGEGGFRRVFKGFLVRSRNKLESVIKFFDLIEEVNTYLSSCSNQAAESQWAAGE